MSKKELIERIEALEAKVAALEARPATGVIQYHPLPLPPPVTAPVWSGSVQ